MNELIKLNNTTIGGQEFNTVSARELHSFLEMTERFSSWMNRQFQYGFEENVDYSGCKVFNTLANQDVQEFYLTLDCAKEIAMLQKSDKGREARKYFIECERQLKEAFSSKDSLLLGIMKASGDIDRALAVNAYETQYVKPLEDKIEQQSLYIEEAKPKVEYHNTVLRCPDLLNITQIAKDFGLTGQKLNKILSEEGVQYKDKSGVWMLYAEHLPKNYAQTHTYVYNDSEEVEHSKLHLKWTQEGRLFIYNLLKEKGILPICELEQPTKLSLGEHNYGI